jgi:hypothetical protein
MAIQSTGERFSWVQFDAFNALFDAHLEHKNKSGIGKESVRTRRACGSVEFA